jgi:hypothetical protein
MGLCDVLAAVHARCVNDDNDPRMPFRLWLPAGKDDSAGATFLTKDISKSGLCFLAPRRVEPGAFIRVEVTLAGYGPGGNDIDISGAGYIVRAESSDKTGWHRLAAAFDEPPPGDEAGWNQLALAFRELK